MSNTIKCSQCGSAKVRMVDVDQLSITPYVDAPYIFDNRASGEAVCDVCNKKMYVEGDITWIQPVPSVKTVKLVLTAEIDSDMDIKEFIKNIQSDLGDDNYDIKEYINANV